MTMDVVLNKKESIERCIKQIRLYYAMPSELLFEEDSLKQDAIAINLQRAAEQAIDLANHVIRKGKLGLPKESKDSFEILAQSKIIPDDLANKLKGMVGFRNILVYEYQEMDIRIMVDVIEHHLDDLIVFTNHIVEFVRVNPS
ncbi:MAG: DUF86 domain-containing protein [Alphaproteobacteria bacterium]|uniref:DUF86 domain-containing protein n=1 Tax=Candidatus Nitrobium versatile TaxID=2884831 RepID=A0A953M1D4_9BACT|nr:DUF86 domain-containing protein [Candidatus Nitrobium versatile]